MQLRRSGASHEEPLVRCRCTHAGSSDPVAVKLYKQASRSVSNIEVAEHEIRTYRRLGTVEGVARMVDSRLDEAAGLACMVQE